jgi:hypothetical protein
MRLDVKIPVEPTHWEGRELVIGGFEEAALAANLVSKDPPCRTRLRSLFNARSPDLSLTSPEPVWLPSTTFRWLLGLPVRLR